MKLLLPELQQQHQKQVEDVAKEKKRIENLKYRAIVRFSINGETDGVFRRHLQKILADAHFLLLGTAEYERRGLSAAQLATVFQAFWADLMAPSVAMAGRSFSPTVHLDHVWTYVAVDHAA